MAKTRLEVSIVLTVDDEVQFRETAYKRALADGLEEENAAEYKDPDSKSLGECAQMILDPGTSPDGCSIEYSASETLDFEETNSQDDDISLSEVLG